MSYYSWIALLFLTIAISLLFTKTGRALVEYIKRDEVPIWLSLALAIATAAGTYFIAPLINQNFEYQKSRSAHLLETVKVVNDLNVGIAVGTRKYNDSLFYRRNDINETRNSVLDKITEAQWRLIDVDTVIKRAYPNNRCTNKMSRDLDALRVAIVDASKPQDQEAVISSALRAGESSRNCTVLLYNAANL